MVARQGLRYVTQFRRRMASEALQLAHAAVGSAAAPGSVPRALTQWATGK